VVLAALLKQQTIPLATLAVMGMIHHLGFGRMLAMAAWVMLEHQFRDREALVAVV
jgi:hypothetical protein